jgi:hypothetical protein
MNEPTPRARNLPLEIAGWYGSVALVGAYGLSSFGAIADTGALYQLLNLTGALGVAAVCWHKRTWQAFWLEAIWALIAVVSLVRVLTG